MFGCSCFPIFIFQFVRLIFFTYHSLILCGCRTRTASKFLNGSCRTMSSSRLITFTPLLFSLPYFMLHLKSKMRQNQKTSLPSLAFHMVITHTQTCLSKQRFLTSIDLYCNFPPIPRSNTVIKTSRLCHPCPDGLLGPLAFLYCFCRASSRPILEVYYLMISVRHGWPM